MSTKPNHVFLEVPQEHARALKTVLLSMVLHAEHDVAAGTTSHYARHATLAASAARTITEHDARDAFSLSSRYFFNTTEALWDDLYYGDQSNDGADGTYATGLISKGFFSFLAAVLGLEG